MSDLEPTTDQIPVRQRLMVEGGKLFSEKGFDGTSVRDICEKAATSSRMIHHYFGSKQGLLDAILEDFTTDFLDVPLRIISAPVDSKAALSERFEIFFAETLHAVMTHRVGFEIGIREQIALPAFTTYYEQLSKFFDQAKEKGLIRQDLDANLITGMVLDRCGNQVSYANSMLELAGTNVFVDDQYRVNWIKANVNLLLHGMLNPN